MTVAVYISEIDPHRKSAGAADAGPGDGAKAAAPIIKPDTVRRKQIVAHIEIRRSISIDIIKNGSESPIHGWIEQWLSIFVQKAAVSKRNGGKPALSVIQE